MTTTILDVKDLEERVRQMYRDVALHPDQGFHFETGRALAERLGYPPGELAKVPAGAVDSFAGVGFFLDLAAIRPSDTVIDLGSGSGMDSLLAAHLVGPSGRVVGVDMTEEQLDKATGLAAEAGLEQVEFRRGHIERLPVADGSADVVISNGVVNLSPRKSTVFAEAARVLCAGGRLALADIVTDRQLPEGITCNASLWAACIGGAAQVDDYLDTIARAGFTIEVVRDNEGYRFLSRSAVNATTTWGVKSISVRARRN
jgi:arsenite methyltransferase